MKKELDRIYREIELAYIELQSKPLGNLTQAETDLFWQQLSEISGDYCFKGARFEEACQAILPEGYVLEDLGDIEDVKRLFILDGLANGWVIDEICN